jgi:Rieske 2Fe-2S family protein
MHERTGLMAPTTPTAPIPYADLEPSLRPFGQSHMLPRAAYVDPAVLRWEQQNFFGGWMCVGRSADLVKVGSQSAVQVGSGSVLLIRGDDGQLRAFVNACRHRGHELLPCGVSTAKRSVVCPYHAWTYKLDGSMRNAPHMDEVEGFDPDQYGLQALPLHEWHGWVFVSTSGAAGSLEEHIGDLERIIAPYHPEDLVVAATHEYTIEANWKVIAENYQECYHCSMIHPELCAVSPPESGGNLNLQGDWVGGGMDLRDFAQTMSLDGLSHGENIDGLSSAELRTVMYVVVFPNLLISLHPDYVMTHRLVPLSPDRTYVECSWAFPGSATARPDFDPAYAVDFWDLTNRQDWAACESVQRGVSAPQWVPGPLAPDEDGVHHFVSRVAHAYAGRLDSTPIVTEDAEAAQLAQA